MKLFKFKYLLLYYPTIILNLLSSSIIHKCFSLSLTSSPDSPGCRGRLKLNETTGFITDGPSFYSINLQCIWLIDSGTDNATISIQIHRFNTECNYDYLYIFDGDSIYSPLVAALSGDIKDFSSNSVNHYNQYQKFNNSPKISLQTQIGSKSTQNTNHNNYINNIRNNPHSNDYYNNSISNYAAINISISNGQPVSVTPNNKDDDNINNNNSMIVPSNQYGRTSLASSSWHRGSHDEPFEIKTYSGKAFIYFHSDTAQSMPGFYLTYSLNSCPLDCSDHGECDKEKLICKCNSGYHGDGCQFVDCPNNCTSGQHGVCDKDKNCMCHQGYQGSDCSTIVKSQTWTSIILEKQTGVPLLTGMTQHQTVLIGDQLYVIGGRTRLSSDTNVTIYKKRKSIMIRSFELDKKIWSNLTIVGSTGSDHLAEVTGHSSASHEKKIYIYGGIALNYTILDTLSVFDTRTSTLSSIRSSSNNNKDHKIDDKLVAPVASVGHSANIVNDYMYIFLGFNPIHGYLNQVQKFNIKSGNWTLIERKGSPLTGCIGHTTNYDPVTELIYLYGGHHAQRLSSLYTFDLKTESWNLLQPGPSPRYYHSALIIDRHLIILGGNSYNTSHQSDQCYQDSYLVYDLNCNRKEFIASDDELHFLRITNNEDNCEPSCWTSVRNTQQPGILKRHGQSVVNYKRNLVLVGGFNGFLLNEILEMPIGSCQNITDENDCNRQKLIIDCSWNVFDSKCENKSDLMVNSSVALHNSFGSTNCVRYSDTEVMQIMPEFPNESPCETRRSCNECVPSKCIWCSTSEKCIDSSAYFAYHPVGQCMHYVANSARCPIAACSDIESCETCLANPKCGWLNDIGNTGKGKCLEGTSSGPSFGLINIEDEKDIQDMKAPSQSSLSLISPLSSLFSSMSLSPFSGIGSSLPGSSSSLVGRNSSQQVSRQQHLPNWHYTSCPACQCNGHSHCKLNNSICVQPCQDNTEGAQCDRCISGYFGDPSNGNTCKPCKCNGHAQSCNRETGKCYCSTKGIIGYNCNRCDEQNHYIGDPLNPFGNGTCYYNLTTDFQYTFNMSKPEDHFYSDINFVNIPTRRDSDVDFTIACSKPALVNITSGTNYKNRKVLHALRECGTIRIRLGPTDRNDLLQDGNQSYYIYVHKFQTPFLLQIAFSQHRTIYLPQVFFTFSSCFLFFFILSGVLWKLKIEYDSYVRRQRQSIEMQQMASRPFSRIFLELFESPPSKNGMIKVPTSDPTPISFEPCFGDNIGILSVFVQLPGGGRPNLAVGSALVNLTDSNEDQTINNGNSTTATTTTTTNNISTNTTNTLSVSFDENESRQSSKQQHDRLTENV